jgi:hypothetical protein
LNFQPAKRATLPGDVEALSNCGSGVKPTAESRHMLDDLKTPNKDWRFCLDGPTPTSTWGEGLMQHWKSNRNI